MSGMPRLAGCRAGTGSPLRRTVDVIAAQADVLLKRCLTISSSFRCSCASSAGRHMAFKAKPGPVAGNVFAFRGRQNESSVVYSALLSHRTARTSSHRTTSALRRAMPYEPLKTVLYGTVQSCTAPIDRACPTSSFTRITEQVADHVPTLHCGWVNLRHDVVMRDCVGRLASTRTASRALPPDQRSAGSMSSSRLRHLFTNEDPDMGWNLTYSVNRAQFAIVANLTSGRLTGSNTNQRPLRNCRKRRRAMGAGDR